MHEVYLSLGSNLGDREQQLKQAIRFIDERIGEVVRQSSFIETEPWGFQSDHRFLRAPQPSALSPHPSSLTHHPSALSPQPSYYDRPIDIDILLYDDWKVSEPDLTIPHPLMHQRDFVMIPLKEIMTEQTNP